MDPHALENSSDETPTKVIAPEMCRLHFVPRGSAVAIKLYAKVSASRPSRIVHR